MIKRFGLILLAFILAIVFLACNATEPKAEWENVQELGQFNKNSVDVTIAIAFDETERPHLLATYTPTRPNFHVYDKDLPPKGFEGAGRPTRLEILSEAIQPVGPLQANVDSTLYDIPGFDQAFPIYPDGPVTLFRSINLAEQTTSTKVELSVTYMACSSDGTCLPPVVDERIVVTIPEITPPEG